MFLPTSSPTLTFGFTVHLCDRHFIQRSSDQFADDFLEKLSHPRLLFDRYRVRRIGKTLFRLCDEGGGGGGACQRGIETTRIIIIISMKTLHLRVSTSRCEATVSSRVPVVVAVGVAAVPPPFAAPAPLKRLFNWSSIHSPALTCPSRLLMQATHSQ